MVSHKRFLLIFASILLLASVPILLFQPNGASSAGLTTGFMQPFQHLWQLVMVVGLGVAASLLPKPAMILVPLGFVLLFVVGMALALIQAHAPLSLLPMFMLGAVMLFALSFIGVRHRAVIFTMLVSASCGFHLGRHEVMHIPDIAAPLYFMIGTIICFSLVLAASASLGLVFLRASEGQEPIATGR